MSGKVLGRNHVPGPVDEGNRCGSSVVDGDDERTEGRLHRALRHAIGILNANSRHLGPDVIATAAPPGLWEPSSSPSRS